jgi:hypothetical protein
VVTLTSPAPGLVTNAAALTVTGTVQAQAPLAFLDVNGVPAMVSGSRFSVTLAPPAGPLNILATATDLAGNTGTATVDVLIDRTPPVITLTSPLPAITRNTTLALAGSVSKPVSALTVNGVPAAVSGQAFSASVALTQEGANAITVAATDLAGNVGTLTAQTVRDTTPPVVSFLSPVDGSISNKLSVTVTGTVNKPTASLLVAGQRVVPDDQGRFTCQYAPSGEGSQLLVAMATDLLGNTGYASRTLVFL